MHGVGTVSVIIGNASICFKSYDSAGLLLGWIPWKYCNHTLVFQNSSLLYQQNWNSSFISDMPSATIFTGDLGEEVSFMRQNVSWEYPNKWVKASCNNQVIRYYFVRFQDWLLQSMPIVNTPGNFFFQKYLEVLYVVSLPNMQPGRLPNLIELGIVVLGLGWTHPLQPLLERPGIGHFIAWSSFVLLGFPARKVCP